LGTINLRVAGRAAAFVAGWSLGTQDPSRGWSLEEQPRAKPGYQRSTLLAAQPAKRRNWSPGDQDPRGDGPQGPRFVRRLDPRGPPSRMPVDGWSSKDQDLRADGPWGNNPVRNVDTKDPASSRLTRREANADPLVTRFHVKMIPAWSALPATWSSR